MTTKDHKPVTSTPERPLMLLVVGPHRSGTSTVARALECLGAVNSPNLMPANEANPKGYFEDNDVYLFNDQVLLPAVSRTWRSASPVDWSVLSLEARSRLELQALEIIRRNYPPSQALCVLKEPRISALLPFWLPVLQHGGFEVRLVGVVRDPLSVSRSLQKRDGFSLARGGLLYLTIWHAVLQHAKEHHVALISFEDLLASPAQALRRLADELQITPPADFENRAAFFASSHLDLSLCHSKVHLQDVALEPELAAKVVETFSLLGREASLRNVRNTAKLVASLGRIFAEVKPLLVDYDRIFEGSESQKEQLRERMREIAQLEAEAERSRGEQASLRGELAGREGRIAQLEAEAERSRGEQASLRGELAGKVAEVARLEVAVETAQKESIDWRTASDSLAHTVKAMRGSTSWRLTAPLRWMIISSRRTLGKAALWPRRLRLRLAHSRLARNPFVRLGRQTLNRGATFVAKLPTSTRVLLVHRRSGLFDHAWYLQSNPDVRLRGRRPFLHFAFHGVFEGRPPHAGFDPDYYLERNPDVAAYNGSPLLHYVLWGFRENRPWRKACTEQPDDELRAHRLTIPRDGIALGQPIDTDIRAIAMYLPQFHAIPENDEWWGQGFTEWTNVRRAVPQYEGHYQPHVPHPELGYYDLTDAAVLDKQAAMARAASIEGFCFYYYWFNGKRLLEMPTDRLIATGQPDFPFCFCWANENWTRTWDGGEKNILIEQNHSYESDERFIMDLLPAFRDSRYIRVEGKPLLVVYRPGLMPDPAATARHWRETCRREGIGEIFLARMQMFDWELEGRDPGYDTVIQFPPVSRGVPLVTKNLVRFGDSAKFSGEIFDYRRSVANYISEPMGPGLWPGVCPSWDNTARRMERGHSWIHSSPEAYYEWLATVVDRARQVLPPQQRFVFINAWNEWAEGCHLEPDEKYGYAWLNATRFGLTGERPPKLPIILVVGHDAARAGAQMVLLEMLREWRSQHLCEARLVLLGSGVLRSKFEEVCDTLVLSDFPTEALQKRALEKFCRPTPDLVLGNTAVVGPLLANLKDLGAPIVAYIHEMQNSIARWAPGPIMRATVESCDRFIAVSAPVAENLHLTHGIPLQKISTLKPYIKTSYCPSPRSLRSIRDELGIQPHEKIVFGCGTVDWRKGPDLFVETALAVLQTVPEARFYWIGGDSKDDASKEALRRATDPRICFLGERENSRDFFALGHAFFLPSREDPFPLVALEAADAGLPVVCFAEAGGMPEFVGNNCGHVVPFEETRAAATVLIDLLTKEDLRESIGLAAKNSVRGKHDSAKGSAAVFAILADLLQNSKKKVAPLDAFPSFAEGGPLVSVIVPNYNHAQFLLRRLESIARQTLTDLEIILMDDFSTDDSLEVLRAFADREPRARLILNRVNSGSTFKQWRKGLAEAKGKYIWLAESDDYADLTLLETLVGRLERNPEAVLAACCPCSVEGEFEHGPPRQWYNELLGTKWHTDYAAKGLQEIREVLSRRNAILNASGVVFRNFPGISDLVEPDMRLCADWLFWVRLLQRGDFEYSPRMLNKWRINSSNARTRPPGDLEWREGRRVLSEVAEILGMDPVGRANLLHAFSHECQSWLANHLRHAELDTSSHGGTPKVTAIVPNYNYAAYLPERLDSILGQTFRDFEILVLDDASTDGSAAIIERYRREHPDRIRVIRNSKNSGSPYPQWLRGIREARGDLVWIAEADDSCEPDFLETLVPRFDDPSIGIAYCQSLGLDGEGRVTRTDFLEHTEGLHADRWKADYTEIGVREALDWMACRNTIPNASAALMRREALLDVGDDLLAYRSCGDWFLYLNILRRSGVAYCARSLNKFRRHDKAVTRTTNQSEAYLAEVANIRRFVAKTFPLHRSQFERLDHFLDRDYVFEGIPRPSQHAATRPLLEEARRSTDGRLRLAFISTNISAHSGGSEILWQKAALEARRRGHDVIVVTKAWRPLPSFSAEFAKAGIKHLETEHGGHDAVISFRPDLAIISTSNENEGWLEFQKFIPAKVPYVVVNQLTKEEQYSPIPDYNPLLQEGFALAEKVFFVSENNRRIMETRLGQPIPQAELVFNPLDIPPGEPIPMPDLSDGLRIAFPANILFIHKGHDLLLEVMAMEKWRQRPVTINLYGQGEDEERVRQMLAQRNIRNVHLRGFTPPEEIWRQNHALLLASRMEGQSLAMIGAMIAGRVPIVTAVGGSAEVIRDNETGFLAAKPTVTDLDDALERAYQRSADWPEIGRAARESALKIVPPDPIGDFVTRVEQICPVVVETLRPEPTDGALPIIKQEKGFCPICEEEAIFTARNAWLRDHYLCSGCGSIPRERAIMHVIQTRYPNWRDLRIHESSPGSRGTSVKLAKECRHYTASQYDPELGLGNTHRVKGYRSEDLEKQTFADESFDLVITQDVMEHIFDAEAALADIHRTLRSGGAHIFTTPLVNKDKPTQQRARRDPDGSVSFLFPPDYHGNPMSNQGSLVTWHYGFDIANFVSRVPDSKLLIIDPVSEKMGICADFIKVCVHHK